MTLLDNGTDSLTVTANGAFTFKTALATGATYSVTVGTQPTGETCTVTNGSGTVGSANVTNVAVACSSGTGGGGGAYWIPYSATPIPQQTPVGKNGLFLIPSDKLTSAPAPTFVTTDNTQLLGIGTQISVKSGVVDLLSSAHDVCRYRLNRDHPHLRADPGWHIDCPEADPDRQHGAAFGPTDLSNRLLGG